MGSIEMEKHSDEWITEMKTHKPWETYMR